MIVSKVVTSIDAKMANGGGAGLEDYFKNTFEDKLLV